MSKLKKYIDDFIVPVKYIDGKIARSYKKIGDKLEKGGVKREYVCTLLNLGSLGFINLHAILNQVPDSKIAEKFRSNPLEYSISFGIAVSYLGSIYHDLAYNFNLLTNKRLNYILNNSIVEDKFNYFSKKIQKVTRMPFLYLGLHSFYDFMAQIPDNFYGEALSCATIFTALASSMYLKDNDPKLLEKQPMWKDALDLAKKGYEKLLPQLAPQPIQSNYSLEDQIEN